jgi:hypothetical protein
MANTNPCFSSSAAGLLLFLRLTRARRSRVQSALQDDIKRGQNPDGARRLGGGDDELPDAGVQKDTHCLRKGP